MFRIPWVVSSVLALMISAGALPGTHADDSASELPEIKSRSFDEARAASPFPKLGERVHVDISGVSFSESWERRYRTGLDPAYRERTQTTYTRLLNEAISNALLADGYRISDDPETADLRVTAGLSKLFTNSPELDVISEHYARYAGSVTFEWELSDASDNPLMSLRGHRQTRYREGPMDRSWRGRVDRDFEQLFIRWSKDAVALLNSLQR